MVYLVSLPSHKNLTESVSTLVARIGAELNLSVPLEQGTNPSSAQVARQEQFRRLLAFSQQGFKPEQIAVVVGLSERTVYRWLTQPRPKPLHGTITHALVA